MTALATHEYVPLAEAAYTAGVDDGTNAVYDADDWEAWVELERFACELADQLAPQAGITDLDGITRSYLAGFLDAVEGSG